MKLFLALSIIFVLSASMFGQSRSQISGSVRDPNGDVIAGAAVSVRNLDTKSESRSVTLRDGTFAFDGLLPATYLLTVLAPGFAVSEQQVRLTDTGVSGLVIALSIGPNQVTVTAEVGQSSEAGSVPQAINIVNSDALSLRIRTTLAEAGTEEAGLNVQKTSPTIGAITIRGLTGKNVANYVDGVRYSNGAQRGGINTFFNLNEPTNLQSVEVLRGPNGAQYGSDSLAGTVNLITRTPVFGIDRAELHGEFTGNFSVADKGFGSSALLSYGTQTLGGYVNIAGRHIGDLRTAQGLDSHSAIRRFLGLPSSVLYSRNPGTGFDQYGVSTRLNYAPREDQQLIFTYQRSQQDGGQRFDQMLGGDGNLVADLRNLMLDFGYLRYIKQKFGPFDSGSFTVSYNSQREERVNQGGQGNPFGDITHQYERTTAIGFSGFLEKELGYNNTFLVGADHYRERINSPAYVHNPVTNAVTLSRPRVPDEATFNTAGVFIQDQWNAIPDRFRITGALRYSGMVYRAKAEDSPIVAGKTLWTDDELTTSDISGRIGAVVRLGRGFRAAFNYSRGFRYPSMTDLGTLGLTGDGFEVDHITAGSLGGRIGTTAGIDAVSTGLSVRKQESEYSNNYDASLRFNHKRFDTELTLFRLDIENAITKQSLILPQGSVGQYLGDQQIISQLPNGVVFVAASTAPVLVRANFTSARIWGVEYEMETRLRDDLVLKGNYTYTRAEDKDTGLPPNIEGGTPPATGFLSLKYDKRRWWVEAYSTLAYRQERLSSLDLSDRRTGAPRSRTQIENYFRRGACVAGLTSNAAGICNGAVSGYILRPTGENITQLLTRVLGAGFAPNNLFNYLPGYGIANLRGGFTINEKASFTWAFENIFDHYHRNASWGIDGAGRSFSAKFRYRF